jgi:hypothetical protein
MESDCPRRQEKEVDESMHIDNFSWQAPAIPPLAGGGCLRRLVSFKAPACDKTPLNR